MHGVAFAAGRGSRLRPLTDDTPKVLLEVGGQSILSRCLEALLDVGVDDLVVVVGYRADDVRAHVGDAFRGTSVTYAHQADRLGMAHAYLAAADHLEGDAALIDGDCVIDADLTPLVERHREPDVDGTLLVDPVPRAAAREKAVCDVAEDGTLRGIVNKPADPPTPAFVAAGFQTASPALVDACRSVERSPRGEYELADAIARLVDRGRRIVAVPVDGWHRNVNTPADLRAARAHFA